MQKNPLKVSHKSLEVKFDGCPRPHLIITESVSSIMKNFGKAQYPALAKDITKKQAQSMIECYEEIKDLVEKLLGGEQLKRFTLVTHLGSFATNNDYLHAHIWMDTDQYKKLLSKAKHVPDSKYKDLKSYVEDVQGHWVKMSNKHKKWLTGERKAVMQAKAKNEKIEAICPEEYEIIFHHCLPYIGFRCKEMKTGEKKTDVNPNKEEMTGEHKTEELRIKEQEKKEQENAEQGNVEQEGKRKKNEETQIKEQKLVEEKTGEKKTKGDIFYDVTQFAKHHEMTEGGDGCHVCLGGQPAIGFIDDGKAVDAFLFASVGTFYKMLLNVDEALANQWWMNFQECIVKNPVLH